MRRLLRWLANGLCLLSLLACAGAAWVWWRAGPPLWHETFLEAAALGADVEATTTRTRLTVRVTGDWPGPAGVWAGAGPEPDAPSRFIERDFFPQAPRREWRSGWGFGVERGWSPVFFDAAGAPARLSEAEWFMTCLGDNRTGPILRQSRPLPYAEVGAPPWAAVALCSLPPALWLASRSSRLYARRRRSRLGLCPRCGYDLRGNTSGVCSECGTAIEAAGRVTT